MHPTGDPISSEVSTLPLQGSTNLKIGVSGPCSCAVKSHATRSKGNDSIHFNTTNL